MNDEARVSLCSLIAAVSWLTTAALLAAAWIVWAMTGPHSHTAILVAETACVASAVAAVAQLRCYGVKLAGLMRLLILGARADAADREQHRGVRPLR